MDENKRRRLLRKLAKAESKLRDNTLKMNNWLTELRSEWIGKPEAQLRMFLYEDGFSIVPDYSCDIEDQINIILKNNKTEDDGLSFFSMLWNEHHEGYDYDFYIYVTFDFENENVLTIDLLYS